MNNDVLLVRSVVRHYHVSLHCTTANTGISPGDCIQKPKLLIN